MYHHKARDPISLYFVFAMHITLTITFYLTLTINSSFINYFRIDELISSLIKSNISYLNKNRAREYTINFYIFTTFFNIFIGAIAEWGDKHVMCLRLSKKGQY